MIRCPDLENPANGVVDDGDNLPGTRAVYKCNDGFRLVGSSKRLCQRDGTWDGRAPVCKCKNFLIIVIACMHVSFVQNLCSNQMS